MPEIITRAEALAEGQLTYFTGKACKHGHVCERYVSQRKCRECTRERHSKKRHGVARPRRARLSPEEKRRRRVLYKDRWRAKNLEKARAYNRKVQAEWTRRAKIAIKVLQELGIEI